VVKIRNAPGRQSGGLLCTPCALRPACAGVEGFSVWVAANVPAAKWLVPKVLIDWAFHLHRNLGSCIPPSQRACTFSLRKHLASSCPLEARLWSAPRHRPWPAQCASLHCAERVPAALRLQHTA
jgi:hypothetical protein